MAIFDFGNLNKLLEMHHPSEIIIVDADFFVNHSDFRTWKTSAKSPVFVISDMLIREIYSLENVKRPESSQLFEDAGVYLFGLIKERQLIKGMYVQDVGWFSYCCFYCSNLELQQEMDKLGTLPII